MKSYLVPTVLSILILAGCSSTKKATDYDDVYASTKKDKNTAEQTADPDYYVQNENTTADYSVEDYEAGDYVSYEEEPVYSETETIENPDGSTYITNNYYGSSAYDYYDYSYAARINRFYSPYTGFSYYSPYYTGFYYDPWYNPYWYSPSFYFGFSWGWGSIGWGYPYYSYYPYYPYNSYWYGYNQGYWNGYWDGYYGGGYYNDYYGYNGYYGHRSSRSGGSNTPVASTSRSHTITPVNRASTYLTMQRNNGNSGISAKSKENGRSNALIVDPSTRSDQTAQTRNNTGSMTKPQNDVSKKAQTTTASRYTYKKPAESGKTRTEYRPGETINTRSTQTSRTQPSQRYSKPSGSTSERSLSNTQQSRSSNSQVYSRPKSNYNNSYSKPSTYSNRKSVQPSNDNSQRYSQPARSNSRTYSQPSRSNTRSYSAPSNSSNSRSYSTPSRSSSSRSYSTPSSSGKSYSAPSRSSSSGSSGGSRSSSSSSRGGRR